LRTRQTGGAVDAAAASCTSPLDGSVAAERAWVTATRGFVVAIYARIPARLGRPRQIVIIGLQVRSAGIRGELVIAAIAVIVFSIPVGGPAARIETERHGLGLGLGPRLRTGTTWNVGGFTLRPPPTSRHGAVVEPDDVAQRVELLLRQLASVADAKLVKCQVCERDPLELVDLVAKRLDHPVDLTMLALVDRDAEPRVLALAGQDLDLGRHRDRAVVEGDAIAQRLDGVVPEPAVDLDVIRLRHVVGRGEQARRELAVVGEQQHALGVEVEPANRLHGDRQVREVVHHGRAPAVIGHRRDAALRLIEQDIEVVERDDRFTVDKHRVVIGIDLGAEHGDDGAVHLDAAGDDQVFGLAARGDPSGREVPLQADRGAHHLLPYSAAGSTCSVAAIAGSPGLSLSWSASTSIALQSITPRSTGRSSIGAMTAKR
jgi:hypothetical protein